MGLLPKFSKTKKLATFFSFIENYLEVGPTSPYLCTRKPQGAEAAKPLQKQTATGGGPLQSPSHSAPIPLPFLSHSRGWSWNRAEAEKNKRRHRGNTKRQATLTNHCLTLKNFMLYGRNDSRHVRCDRKSRQQGPCHKRSAAHEPLPLVTLELHGTLIKNLCWHWFWL